MSGKIAKWRTVKKDDVFGELTVIGRDFERETSPANRNRRKYFLCRCSCGNITSIDVFALLRGATRSCGHLRKQNKGSECKNLLGQKFNHLTVIKIDETKARAAGKHVYWICECDICGNTKSVRSSDLLSEIVKDCGCQKSARISNGKTKDLNGQTFGHLTVLHRDLANGYHSGKHARWICECELCGQTESVSSDMLTTYGKDRCKLCAGVSMGENKIVEILNENGISYIHDKPYLDCRSPNTDGALRFDFRINQSTDCDYIIEFDGEQHFKFIPQYEDRTTFEDRIGRDRYKDQWCREHNIPLIRIPYKRLNKLCVDDLKIETTKYLIS